MLYLFGLSFPVAEGDSTACVIPPASLCLEASAFTSVDTWTAPTCTSCYVICRLRSRLGGRHVDTVMHGMGTDGKCQHSHSQLRVVTGEVNKTGTSKQPIEDDVERSFPLFQQYDGDKAALGNEMSE